ncbi:MAG: phage tail sheath subtilisin-like domain-containing protein [Edaphocola sp.]
MAVSFLHGVETIEQSSGARTISTVKTAVIGLVGIAPTGPVNEPTLVVSDTDAAQFGSKLPGFSIPQSLDAIFKQGAGTVIVVNVFDADAHTAQVTDETLTVADGKLKLGAAPIGTVTITDGSGVAVTYVSGTDYSIDDFGNFKTISNLIANGTVLKFSYKKLDGAAVTASTVIGAVDAATDARTGMKCWDLSFNLFGYNPKILIAPTFSSLAAVATELTTYAEQYRAITYLDAPAGTSVATAIAGRGPSGTINFYTSSKRTELLYPELKWYDADTDSDVTFPYSAFKAGIRAKVDNDEGYWWSDSNHEIKGITGAEVNISGAINDASTDANTLNAAGITTILNTYGSGIRTWGNRSAAYPGNTEPDNFICVRRVADTIHDSVEQACLQLIDQPITQGWIDTVRESVNAFIRTLVGRGALIDGTCKYLKSDNPATELAAGHVTFHIDFMPPTPAERITFNSYINIEYLTTLS